MTSGIKTFYALKSIKIKRFLRKPIVHTVVVASTCATNWLWAELHFVNDGVNYDEVVEKV